MLIDLLRSDKYIDSCDLDDFLQKAYQNSESFLNSFWVDAGDFLVKADRFCSENMEVNPESFQWIQHELTALFSNGLKLRS